MKQVNYAIVENTPLTADVWRMRFAPEGRVESLSRLPRFCHGEGELWYNPHC